MIKYTRRFRQKELHILIILTIINSLVTWPFAGGAFFTIPILLRRKSQLPHRAF